MKILEINYYPIKSFPGISVSQSNVLPHGLENDRKWMLIGEDFNPITLRQIPELIQFSLQTSDIGISLSHQKESNTIDIPWEIDFPNEIETKLFGNPISLKYTSNYISEFISDKLNRKVYFAKNNSNQQRIKRREIGTFPILLHDGAPISIIGTESISYVSDQIDQSLNPIRFRGNIIIKTGTPFEEDSLKEFTINNSRFIQYKQIPRCVVITIDPKTGRKSSEPLKYLSKYHSNTQGALFGIYVFCDSKGKISTEDMLSSITFK